MNRTHTSLSVLALGALAASFAIAQPETTRKQPTTPTKDTTKTPTPSPTNTPTNTPGQPTAPGALTDADMQACAAAAAPGPMHAHLAKNVGTWTGKVKMWMPGTTEPTESTCTTTFTSTMGGRYFRCETNGEMPGMGPFEGFGVSGFDNVTNKFQGTWCDNMCTGMMTGTGELASDGSTINWSYKFNCPIAKKEITMRQVERHQNADSMSLTMYGPNPKTGKEEKCMEIAYTRTAGATPMNTPLDPTKLPKPTTK